MNGRFTPEAEDQLAETVPDSEGAAKRVSARGSPLGLAVQRPGRVRF
jgi:hypothetical protein